MSKSDKKYILPSIDLEISPVKAIQLIPGKV
jgi:hypothetical protein